MTEEHIQHALSRLFEKHRIVFWYDEKKELRDAYESLELENIEKVEIQNNEFTLKHRMLREAPKKSFPCVQREQPSRGTTELVAVDIELDNTVFTTDQSAIWLSELELPQQFLELVVQHAAFFDASKAAKQAETT